MNKSAFFVAVLVVAGVACVTRTGETRAAAPRADEPGGQVAAVEQPENSSKCKLALGISVTLEDNKKKFNAPNGWTLCKNNDGGVTVTNATSNNLCLNLKPPSGSTTRHSASADGGTWNSGTLTEVGGYTLSACFKSSCDSDCATPSGVIIRDTIKGNLTVSSNTGNVEE